MGLGGGMGKMPKRQYDSLTDYKVYEPHNNAGKLFIQPSLIGLKR